MIHLKISSLEEKALLQVAINLCQEILFKEVALRLERPSYGIFFLDFSDSSCDEEDDEKTEEAENDDVLSYRMHERNNPDLWDALVQELCQRLTEGFPSSLKQKLRTWINHIALCCLSYGRRQEALFRISPYFLVNILTRDDWTETGELDEVKLAKRLLEDERLSCFQRYRIACVYCLDVDIRELWKRLTREEKQSIVGNDDPNLSQESHRLVLLWSYHMDGNREEKVMGRQNHLWTYAAEQATYYGNRAALMSCWKRLEEHKRQQMIINIALECVRTWQTLKANFCHTYRDMLVSDKMPETQSVGAIEYFNLPSYYIRLMFFFLSQMDDEQQLTFFKNAFQGGSCNSVLECFLNWPHQDDLLPSINQLWEIIPQKEYKQCLLTIAGKYSEDFEEDYVVESRKDSYDYQSLLWSLWKITPEKLKLPVLKLAKADLLDERNAPLLLRLLERTPFQGKAEALFKLVFSDQPQKERRAMMNSEVGEEMCSILIKKENWSFLNWLLEECLPKKKIPSFKKKFIKSDCGLELCLCELEKNREKLVGDLIDWSFKSDMEKTRFKYHLVSEEFVEGFYMDLLYEDKFAEVERIINFCVPSDEMKESYKVHLAKCTCIKLLPSEWEVLDKILAWGVDAEEKIRGLKKDIFSDCGIKAHYEIVFDNKDWKEAECFYKWFDLSDEEIRKLKKDTVFRPETIKCIENKLHEYADILVPCLRWCLSNEKMVIDLKKKVEEKGFKQVLNKKQARQQLDCLVSELLSDFKKGKVPGERETNRENYFRKNTGEKRSVEDKSGFPRKQRKLSNE